MTTDPHRSHRSTFIFLLVASMWGCRDAPLAVNIDTNNPPVALAGDAQKLDYDGSPVTVTLDGSGSFDVDGKIVTYKWLSGTKNPNGAGSIGPNPDDVESPSVMLDEGVWLFTLFVIDDAGEVSDPSVVKISVGNAYSKETQMCAEASLGTISEDCRLCACDMNDACKMAVPRCDQSCWDFYSCVQNSCGEFVGGDMDALADCVRGNCTDFFAGVGLYMPAEPCLTMAPCTDICSASATGM